MTLFPFKMLMLGRCEGTWLEFYNNSMMFLNELIGALGQIREEYFNNNPGKRSK